MQQEVRLQGKSPRAHDVTLAAAPRVRALRRRVHPRARPAATRAREAWGE